MNMFKHKYVIIVIIIFISSILNNIGESVINTDIFNGYAIIGSNPTSKMTFTTLLSKPNKTLPFSDSNQYSVVQLFFQSGKTFGSSVGLGESNSGVTIGAIGDSSGSIYVYDIETCVQNSKESKKCDYLFVEKSVKGSCSIGSIVKVGQNFIVSSCSDDLLSTDNQTKSPISVCILNLSKVPNGCSKVLYIEESFWEPCSSQGQMFTNSLEVFGNKIIIGLCGMCMSPSNTQLGIEYMSAFLIVEIVDDYIVYTYSKSTNRTGSCPSSITFNNNWVVIGYSEEESIDIYYKNNSNSGVTFPYFGTIHEPTSIGYGVDLEISQNMLLVSSTGDPSLNITANVFFYDIFNNNNNNNSSSTNGSNDPVRAGSNAMIPNLNYQTSYNYQYGISFYQNEVLVISLDQTQKTMGFNFFCSCPGGMEWSSDLKTCILCDAGQYKPPSKIHLFNESFELCVLCPGGYYSGDNLKALSILECSNNGENICTDSQFCPDGTIWPIQNIPIEITSQTFPDLDDTEQLDFESTFYNSCYPYFLIIMGSMALLTVGICFPWNTKLKPKQEKLIKFALSINFFDWDGESMNNEEIEYVEKDVPGAPSKLPDGMLPSDQKPFIFKLPSRTTYKRTIFIRKKVMKSSVKPVKILETFCTYYFLVLLGLMFLFIIQFSRINNDISTELRSLGQASAQINSNQVYSDAQYLKFVDSSPMVITIDLFGYNGNCSNDELNLIVNGCHSQNYMGICKFETDFKIIKYDNNNGSGSNGGGSGMETPLSNQTCRITTSVETSQYDDTTDFYFNLKPLDTYFYIQRLIYNVSTNNNANSINSGNSYVSGVIQPIEGTILRSAIVSILSMMSMISDCKIKPDEGGLPLIRPMIERCVYDPQSFKEFSFTSNGSQYIDSSEFHLVSPIFQFNIHLEKSVFYHYLMNSKSISFGQIITVIFFAILDVYWIISLFVPIAQTFIEFVEEKLKNRKKKKEKDNPETKRLINT